MNGTYNRLLNDRLYLGGFSTFFTDEIADLDYRFDLGLSAGYHVYKNDKTTLSLEIGPGYVWEQQDGRSDSFAALRFAQRLEHQLNPNSKIWQSLVYTPELEDFGNSLLVVEAGIDFRITHEWALRTSLRFQFDNTPADGRDQEDLLLLTGLTYSLGGIADEPEEGRKSLMPGEDEPTEDKMGWTTTAAASFSMATGNSDNLLFGLSLDSAYRQEAHETFLAAAYNFSQNDGDTSADSLRTSAQHNRLSEGNYFVGAGAGYFRDDIADVDYRFTPNISGGYYLIKDDDLTLSLEAGPGYTFEKVGGRSTDFFSINATEKLTWDLNKRMSLNQNLGIIFDPSSSDYILTANASLDTEFTKDLYWRIAVAWTRDNTPAEGLKSIDSTLTSGISMRF